MILIVDDKKENLFSLKSLLQLHAYDVDTAESGEDALKKVLKQDYSLIILDVQMPGMDGYEVAETITGYSRSKDIPIIFLSAVNIDKRFITKGYAAGGADYVTKPFDPDLLMLKVKTFIRLHDQKRELVSISNSLQKEAEARALAQQELQQLNATLEKKVADRTRELRRSNTELERSNAELNRFAFIASHDLQEPLRKIMVFSQMAMDKYTGDDQESGYFLTKTIDSAARMRNLIDDLLEYSRVTGSLHFSLTPLDELLAESLADLEVAVRGAGATVIADPLPAAEVAPVWMRQVFQNLISNAVKFARENVPPVIRISNSILPAGNMLQIRFADNGIGFENEFNKTIFDLFRRLHGRSQFPGTGIGLAIVKKVIEKHNGHITAESEPGKGTVFTVTLPLTQNTHT